MKVTQMTYACLTSEPVFYPCPLFPSWFPASSLFLRDVNQGPTKRAQVLNLQGCPLQWKISCRGNNMKPNLCSLSRARVPGGGLQLTGNAPECPLTLVPKHFPRLLQETMPKTPPGHPA